MKNKKFWLWFLLSLLWIALIFWHSSKTASQSESVSLGFLHYIRKLLPWMTDHILRKTAHFTEFAVLGVFLTGAFYYVRNFILLKPLAFSLLIALCDETLQLRIPGRCGSLTDVWLDFGGAVFGVLLMWLIFRPRRK